ncbi:MAG: PaaI family thioesterase [Pseudomonadota bacterium]
MFTPKNTGYESRVRASFANQKIMSTLGGSITSVEPGRVILEMPFNANFTQQHGFLHAGAITTMLDSAAGYAAFSLMAKDAEVLTIELKTSLMSPALGDHFRFEGKVVKSGRTISFCEADAYALSSGKEKRIASMTATMMAVTDRRD